MSRVAVRVADFRTGFPGKVVAFVPFKVVALGSAMFPSRVEVGLRTTSHDEVCNVRLVPPGSPTCPPSYTMGPEWGEGREYSCGNES